MTSVYNLATSDLDAEYAFGNEVTPQWAVCYAYADTHNLKSLLFSVHHAGHDLKEYFPIVHGKNSVCCGDYVVFNDKYK